VTTDSSEAASACEPYREFIEHGVACGRNAMAIWQELVIGMFSRFLRKRQTLRSQTAWHPESRSARRYPHRPR
jgi:hypothetical protein